MNQAPGLYDHLDRPAVHPADLCAATAEAKGWDRAGAEEFILAYLANFGPTSGEVLVSEASKVYPPHNRKAFGGIFASLSRRKLIRNAGSAPRTISGNSGGAIVWALT